MLIVLEGIDASGKATQTEQLRHAIDQREQFDQMASFSFPNYDSPTGKTIKEMLARGGSSIARAQIFQSLMMVNRCEQYDFLYTFSNEVKCLILDRYWLSGVVYGQIDGLDRNWLIDIQKPLPTARHQFLIDITVEESFRRRPERRDAIEANRVYLDKVRQLYLAEFAQLAKTDADCEYHVIDGMREPEAVTEQIMEVFQADCPYQRDVQKLADGQPMKQKDVEATQAHIGNCKRCGTQVGDIIQLGVLVRELYSSDVYRLKKK